MLHLLVVLGCLSAMGASPERKTLFFYKPEQSVLEGTLTRETFPEQPGYESIKNGDEPATYWILNLSKPIDVHVKPGVADEFNEDEANVRRLQLILDYETVVPKKIGFKPGRKIRVTGELMCWLSGHHHTRVLMDVQQAELLR